MMPCRSLDGFHPIYLPGVGGLWDDRENFNAHGFLVARVNGLLSSVPLNHWFALAVAGSFADKHRVQPKHRLSLQGDIRSNKTRIADERGDRRMHDALIGRQRLAGQAQRPAPAPACLLRSHTARTSIDCRYR